VKHSPSTQDKKSGQEYAEALANCIYKMTGGVFRPASRDPYWKELADRLLREKRSPEEFCYFVMYFLEPDSAPANHLLIRKAYITSDPVWDKFLVFKAGRQEQVDITVQLQREAYSVRRAVYGNPIQLLRDSKTFTMNPILRADMALMHISRGEQSFMEVLDKYIEEAEYQLEGNPEYRKHCWFLTEYLKGRGHRNVSSDKG